MTETSLPGSTSDNWSRASRASAIGGVIAVGASAAAAVIRGGVGPMFSIASAAALLACVAVAVVASRRPSLGVGAAIGAMFALAPNVLFGATWALAEPLVGGGRCGTGQLALPVTAVVTSCIGATFAIPIAMVVQTVARDALRALVAAAIAVTLAGAVATGFGVASLRRPDPDDFARAFPQRAHLEPGQSADLSGVRLDYVRDASGECSLAMSLHAQSDPQIQPIARCRTLSAMRDPSGLLVVEPESGASTFVFRQFDHYLVSSSVLTVHDLAPELGVPRAWVGASVLGILVALLALAGVRASRRRARRDAEGAIEGVHQGAGWVLAGSARTHVSELDVAEPGPVVVRSALRRPATYRREDAHDMIVLHRGTMASLSAERREHAAAWACLAIAAVAMTCAPLCAARLCGIL